ncbi:MAG: hypothetical protein WCJ29_04035 [bacterium]
MELNREILQKAATLGSAEASASFSKLSSEKVIISVSEVDFVPSARLSETISLFEDLHPTVAYSQVISGIEGVSVLAMSREDALNFIDLLNKNPIGSTGVLMDIDRSAIKETLNIISNSFLNSLAKKAESQIFLSDPHLITTASLKEIFHKLMRSKEEVIVFRTVMEVAEHQIRAELYLMFEKGLADVVKEISK